MTLKILLAGVALLAAGTTLPAYAQSEDPVQAQMVRTMTMTCKPDESIKFYRDVLGMTLLRDNYAPDVMVQHIAKVPKGSRIRFIIMGGTGEYPAGPIIGSRIGFLGITDPNAESCKNMAKANQKREHGEIIMPTRVSNMKEIHKRAKAMGIQFALEPGPSPSRLTTQALLWDPNGIMLELFELHVTPIPE